MIFNKNFWVIALFTIWSAHLYPLCRTPKIIGLVPVRNEELFIEQCLRALALYTDAIIVLDDASEDGTVAIVEALADECRVEKIIRKKVWRCQEGNNRNELLRAGREAFGTHFIVMDADEMFTAPCKDDNFLRKKILELAPGEALALHHIRLWKGVDQWRADNAATKEFVFYDDGDCFYDTSYLHTSRVPMNLKSYRSVLIDSYGLHGVLHFQAINWENVRMRKAWYLCVEAIHRPEAGSRSLNDYYRWLTDETGADIRKCPAIWYSGYTFFDPKIAEKEEVWKKEYVRSCLRTYGPAYFAALDLGCLNLN